MRNVKQIALAAVTLMLVCAVVVAALAATNLLTKDVIAEQEAQATAAACAEVIDADRFEECTLTDGEGKPVVYYEAFQGDRAVGYVFSVSVTGKSSGLVVMTGVSADGAVTGVAVTSNNETAGYIDKLKKGGLFERFVGKTADDAAQVDAVSQATKSSNGVKKGVTAALAYFAEVNGNG